MNVLEPPPVPDLSAPTIAALREHLLDQLEHSADTPRRTRRRILIGGVAAVAAAAAIIATVTISNTGTPSADAAWNAVPSPVTPAQLAHVEALCRRGAGASSVVGQHVVVAERRNESYLLVFVGPGNRISDCALPHPYAPGPQAQSGGWSDSTSASQSLARPAGSGATVIRGIAISNQGSGKAPVTRTSIYGRSGPGVSKITFQIGANTGTATVNADGWWAAWYPGNTAVTSVLVTDQLGHVHSQPVD